MAREIDYCQIIYYHNFMQNVKVFILRAPGTNCDYETAMAFQKVGAQTNSFHISQWLNNKSSIHQYHILTIPGGFTYGDDIGAGTILANEIIRRLINEINKFIEDGKLIIGICNGFQMLVKTGLLPGLSKNNNQPLREAILFTNDSARYEDRWVYLKNYSKKCVFTKDMPNDVIYLPVAHGEGKFITKDKETLKKINDNNQVVFRYSDYKGNPSSNYPLNPNGTIDNIAAICDKTGRIMGMMPHPERFQDIINHPRWTRLGTKKTNTPDGIFIFQNAVNYVKNNL
jgi:phosphoribosylformylglycinamidine synthase subunit PurQ / glutaminase